MAFNTERLPLVAIVGEVGGEYAVILNSSRFVRLSLLPKALVRIRTRPLEPPLTVEVNVIAVAPDVNRPASVHTDPPFVLYSTIHSI